MPVATFVLGVSHGMAASFRFCAGSTQPAQVGLVKKTNEKNFEKGGGILKSRSWLTGSLLVCSANGFA